MKRAFMGVAVALALLATVLTAQTSQIRIGGVLDCTRGTDSDGNVQYCIETSSVGDNSTHTSLPTALAEKVTAPTATTGLVDGLALTYQTGDSPPWQNRQLAAAGLADGAVIARVLAQGIITPAHLSTGYTSAQWNAIFGITASAGTGLPSGANAGNWLTYKAGGAEWADLPAANANQAGIITAAEWARLTNSLRLDDIHSVTALTNNDLQSTDAFLFDDASVTVGSQLKEVTVAELDKRWRGGDSGLSSVASDATLTGTGTASAPLAVATPVTDRLRDFEIHGLEGDSQAIVPGATALHIGDKPNASNLEFYTYMNSYEVGPRYTNQWAGIRIPIADKANVDHYTLQIGRTDGSYVFARYPGSGWEHVVDSEGYARYVQQVADKPASDGISVWRYQKLGIDGDDVSIDYDKLDNLPDLQDGRELISGPVTPGIAVTSLSANSAVGRTNLSEALNVDTEPHGVLLSLLTPTVSGFTATDIRFAESEYDGETTIESVARAPPYNGTTQLGRVLVQADLYKGPTLAGTVQVRLAHDLVGHTFLTTRYVANRGHTLSDSGSIALTLELFVQGAGVPRGTGGGSFYVFPEITRIPGPNGTLSSSPANAVERRTFAANFADDSIIFITGGPDKGGWVKSSFSTNVAADTGLGGKALTVNTDLGSVADVADDLLYFSRAAFTGPNGTRVLPSTSWTAAPAQLARIVFQFRHSTLDHGSLTFTFTSARSYTGAIVLSVGSNVYRLTRSNATTWSFTGLTRQDVHNLRLGGSWSFSEPDAAGYNITHTITKFLAGAS